MARSRGVREHVGALLDRLRRLAIAWSPTAVARGDRPVLVGPAPRTGGLRSAAAVSLALIEASADRPGRAEDAYLSGLEVSRAQGDLVAEARLHAAIATARAARGDAAAAAEALGAATALALPDDPGVTLAIAAASAAVAEASGHPDAVDRYREVAALAERQGARFLRAKATLLAASLEPDEARTAETLTDALTALALEGYRDVFVGRDWLAGVVRARLDDLALSPSLRAEIAALVERRDTAAEPRRPVPHSGDPIRLGLLGSFEIRRGDEVASAGKWRTARAKEFLAFLVMARELRAPRDAICAALWPDASPAAAVSNFHFTLHALRQELAARALHPALSIEREGGSYLLAVRGDWSCDVLEFLADVGADHGPLAAPADRATLERLRAADALYRPFLEDLRGEWIEEARAGLEEHYERMLHTLVVLELRFGETDAAVRLARRLVHRDPLDEAAQRALLEALDRAGEGVEALRQFRVFEKRLRDELHAAPQPQTAELAARVRARAPR